MSSLKHVRYALLLVAAFLYLADTGSAFRSPLADGRVSATVQVSSASRSLAVSGRAVTSSLPDECWEICGETADCEEPCMFYPPPPFDGQEITCGLYDGGGANGQCIGECGDDYCNGGAGEDPEQCVEDCGYCGDEICDATFGSENSTTCYVDCAFCGDGSCQALEGCFAAYQCGDDCGSCDNVGDDCETPMDVCGSGGICNPQHYCVEPGDRGCGLDPHGCCSNEVWFPVNCDWVLANEGQQAYENCVLDYCLQGYGCGVCVPVGPASPVR